MAESTELTGRSGDGGVEQHGVVVCDALGTVVHASGLDWLPGSQTLAHHRQLVALVETDGGQQMPEPGQSGWVAARARQGGRRLRLSSHPLRLPGPAGAQPEMTIYVLAQTAPRERAIDRGIAAVLSHELRTPITTIYAGAQMLLHRSRLSEESQREMLADIQVEADRLYRLVEDLLVANRGRAGIEIVPEPVLLQRLLPRVVALETPRWPHVEFATTLTNDLPAVRADERYLEQVVRDLLANAGSFSADGAIVRVAARQDGESVEVRVLDDGPGIEPGEAAALFRPFGGLQPAGGGRPGPGLGLYVCKLLVEAMGGRIWARRRPSGGSEFAFSLLPYGEEALSGERPGVQ